jgi:hypothetical protein
MVRDNKIIIKFMCTKYLVSLSLFQRMTSHGNFNNHEWTVTNTEDVYE